MLYRRFDRMKNIISHIEKLLVRATKGKGRHTANSFIKGSIKGWGEIISGGANNPGNRKYNKDNLRIAFNRYDMDALASDKTSEEYLFEHNL